MSSFSQALMGMRHRKEKWARAGWNGKGMYVEYNDGESVDERQLPYLQMLTVDGDIVPWLASQTDLLADDWGEVKEPRKIMPADIVMVISKPTDKPRRRYRVLAVAGEYAWIHMITGLNEKITTPTTVHMGVLEHAS